MPMVKSAGSTSAIPDLVQVAHAQNRGPRASAEGLAQGAKLPAVLAMVLADLNGGVGEPGGAGVEIQGVGDIGPE